ncbi:MAG: single-stranded DNA-binding protein [Bacilli bacterium]|nr:single-stranded DNA-binding protein [Bacilli bacterium]
MNNVSLIGRLTQDPELRTTSSGASTCSFTIAVDGRPINGEPHTDFIRCVAWSNQAENLCKYQHKGSQIGVTGRIQTGQYTAQDGSTRYTTDVVADRITFLGSKGDSTPNTSYEMSNETPVETASLSEDPYANMGEETVLSDEDLPF